MKFYRVNAECDGMPYCTTVDEAKKLARHAAANSYDDITVEIIEVSTGKQNILRLLNTSGGTDVPQGTVYTAKAGKERTHDGEA